MSQGAPPEVWLKIFYFACTDTGAAGRALSLVSKAFNEGSKPFKLRSISITGFTQLAYFVEMLSAIDPRYRITEFLFVSSVAMLGGGRTPSEREAQRHDLADRRRLARWTQPSDEEAVWTEHLLYLLQALSATLHTLSIHGSVPRMCTLLPLHLPNVVDLSIHTPILSLIPDEHAVVPFPNLRYLKLVVFPIQPIMLLHHIRDLAPTLEYLLLSVVEKPRDLYHALQEALWMPDLAGQRWGIKQVHVEPSHPPSYLRSPSSSISGTLHELARRDKRVTVHPVRPRWDAIKVQEDWLASISGNWAAML